MSHIPQSLKGKMGAQLLQLHDGIGAVDGLAEEITLMLVDRGLAKLQPGERPHLAVSGSPIPEPVVKPAIYSLTGAGKQLVLTHSRLQLVAGQFLLPGDSPWYDRWPWKLVWPAVLSLIVSVATVAVKDRVYPAPVSPPQSQSTPT